MKAMSRLIFATGAFSLLLAACNSTSGGCPPLVTYSAVQQRRASAELHGLPRDSEIAQMIVDYGKTRTACRAP